MLAIATPSSPPVSLGPREVPLSPGAPPPASPLDEPLPPAPPAVALFPLLVQEARRAGAFVSQKLQRVQLPPLRVPGLGAAAPFVALEQIVRIPRTFQLTYGLVKSRAPSLVAAVRQLSGEARIECPEVVAFVAQQLQRLEAHGTCGEALGGAWHNADWLDLFFGMQLGSDFSNMPHRLLIGNEAARRVLLPSSEVHNADWNHSALWDTHTAILCAVPSEVLGPHFEVRRFVQAYLLLLTRTFGRKDGNSWASAPVLVPLADMLNHSAEPNATWGFSDDGDFVVKAARAISAGEEIFISYGCNKSNVRLFRTYGFTLPPEAETCCSFRVWPSLASSVFADFIPRDMRGKVLDLETLRVDSSTSQLLEACSAGGADPAAFLRSISEHCLAQYENDPMLQPALERLRSMRAAVPRSHAWWPAEAEPHGADCAEGSTLSPSNGCMDDAGPGIAQCGLRVKMSEYLCLVAHLEALDVLEGIIAEGDCLDLACKLVAPLRDALQDCQASGEAAASAPGLGSSGG